VPNSCYSRTPEEDISLGLQPDHGTYRKDTDTNLTSLIDGSSVFGQSKPSDQTPTQDESISNVVETPQDNGEIGRQEVVRIPENCPNCTYPGESLTAITDIPHFKEVIIMAFTCSQCGYKNSEVRGGGAVPTYGTEVTLIATSPEDLKR
jgi:zinc finger protein